MLSFDFHTLGYWPLTCPLIQSSVDLDEAIETDAHVAKQSTRLATGTRAAKRPLPRCQHRCRDRLPFVRLDLTAVVEERNLHATLSRHTTIRLGLRGRTVSRLPRSGCRPGSIRRSSVGVIHRSLFSRAQDICAVDEGPQRVVPVESFNRLVRRDECRRPACRVLSKSMRDSVPNLGLHAVLPHLKSAARHCRHIGGGTREFYCYQRCRQTLHTGQPL